MNIIVFFPGMLLLLQQPLLLVIYDYIRSWSFQRFFFLDLHAHFDVILGLHVRCNCSVFFLFSSVISCVVVSLDSDPYCFDSSDSFPYCSRLLRFVSFFTIKPHLINGNTSTYRIICKIIRLKSQWHEPPISAHQLHSINSNKIVCK